MQTIIRYGKQLIRYVRNSRAVSALEYAILIGVISVALGAIITAFTDEVELAVKAIGDNVKTEAGKIGKPAPSP